MCRLNLWYIDVVFLFKAQILKILSVIYRLVQSNSYATKRFFIINPYFTKANI